ncbi:unnamed protein product [Psylliodes chrysocephalus]|uniref:Peptidase S1 domain-containing protein n=1 Tax=Psylliodes chrysocephalus TaxID=3402493 RepID=A0A9P0D011_9CUCU|nr:unnamed protein product [Psylliodes chrysocephala]
MKTLIIFLVTIVVAQAEIDWSKVTANHVGPGLKNDVASQSRSGTLKIVGGDESVPHSRPYQVGILITMENGVSFCGGSLIGLRTVLTAAHCVHNITGGLEVILGAHFINSRTEKTQVRYNTSDVRIHPNWDLDRLQNDVALVYLPENVTLNENIQLVELPEVGSNALYTGEEAIVTGWGKDSDDIDSLSPVLREVTIPVIDNEPCNTRYLGAIVDSHLCADGISGKSSCAGDTGGPLVFDGVQIGIVSFEIILGCEVGWPSVYARVTYYNDWIRQYLK